MKQVDDLRKQDSMKLYQVLVLSKAADDHESFRPYESLIFGSVEEAKRFMATKETGDRAIVWNDTMTGGEGVVAYGQTHPESEWFGFHYHIQALSVWSDSVVVVPTEKIQKERDEARKAAEYWHRRFFMTDCYDGCDPLDNGWRPLKWGANGEAIYTEPPVEDEDCDGGDAHCVNLKYPGQTAQQVADHKMDGDL